MSYKISPISVEKVKQLCTGEVKIDETLSFKSKLPVRDGLFCQKIFGPIKDYTCECGKYSGKKFAGKVCENCGVTILSSKSRSERMGYIDLQLPIINPMLVDAVISILGIGPRSFEKYMKGNLACAFIKDDKNSNIVLNSGVSGRLRLVNFDDPILEQSPDEYHQASIAIYNLLVKMDVQKSLDINNSKILKLYYEKKFDLKDLFLKLLPVSPVSYRPVINMDTHYKSDPKNDLYLRITRRSVRLKRLLSLNAEEENREILAQENNMIYKAVYELFFGGATDGKKNDLSGIIEGLSKKEGLIRQNLLGKRVDFSGRTAITSGGDRVDIDEIGIPRMMVYELFKPFIISEILQQYAETYKEAKELYKKKSPVAIKCMEIVVKGRRVLMNRNPTLHRYGVMSFRIKLVDGKVLLLHPMICAPFGGDFDGDQVSIHVPISDKALEECEELMSPKHNIIGSLDSTPMLNVSHEMVIGLFMMTRITDKKRYDTTIFKDMTTLEYLHSTFDESGHRNLEVNEKVSWKDNLGIRSTCYGRLLLENLLETKQLPDVFTKKSIKQLTSRCFDTLGPDKMLDVLNKFMKYSLHYATVSGFSISSSDCVIPATKDEKVFKVQELVDENQFKADNGEITEDTKFENNIRLWDSLITDLQKDWLNQTDESNSVKMMLQTGARVSMTQVSQLNVAKGLITDVRNKIIEKPIINSLKEGLSTFEYFQSCSGSRKSMADKMKLTPDSGYLTRRMVTVSRDFFIVEDDCKTTEGIFKPKKYCSGRFTVDGNFITKNNEPDLVEIRTPIHCKSHAGFCTKCYGIDPATRKLVKIGANVGTIAAQSLTESTTQMTMRTFHFSGAAVISDSPLVVKSSIDGKVHVHDHHSFKRVVIDGKDRKYTYFVDQKRSVLHVKNGDTISANSPIAIYTHEELENDDVSGSLPKTRALYEASIPANAKACAIAPVSGEIHLETNGEAIIIKIDDRIVGTASKVPVFVAEGQYVNAGDILSYGSPNIGAFYKTTKNLNLTYGVFEKALVDICEKEGISPSLIHFETIFRCMSNLVLMDSGVIGLRSHGDVGEPLVLGIAKIGMVMPSWLKSIGYGYTSQIIKSSAINLRETYDLSSERLMSGSLIFEREKNAAETNV